MKTLNKSTDSRFKMSKVALTVSAVMLGSVSAGQVFAAEDKETEVIEVVGIRGGIIAGLDLKRNSDNIVDAVSSEDMGKFPDANLAEALQRIPEVSIDRDGGEGRFVTIRGLGPEFNQVLLNGRKLASSEATRAFSFDTIASEMVSEMLVYKTQDASLSEGGLGGTIDVRTARPLDNDGLKIAGSIKGLYEEHAETTNPQASFFISNTFMDGTVGALFGATYQTRESKTYNVNSTSIINTPFAGSYANGYAYHAGDFDNVYMPIELSQNVIDQKRDRLGINGVLQFRPNDKLEITVDYLYSKFEVEKTTNQKSNWLVGGVDVIGSDLLEGYSTQIDSNNVLTEITRERWGAWTGGTATAYNRLDEYRDTETQMFGINAEYQITDDLQVVLDGAWSKATDDNKGRNKRRSLETSSDLGFAFNLGADVPYPYPTESAVAHNAGAEGIEDILRIRRQWNEGNDIEAENFQLNADFTYTAIDDLTIRSGVAFESSKKANTSYDTPNDVKDFYHRANVFLPAGSLDLFTNGIIATDSAKFGQPGGFSNNMYTLNEGAITAFINDPMNAEAYVPGIDGSNADNTRRYEAYKNNGGYGATETGESFDVDEEVTSFYIEGSYEFMLGDMEGNLTGGLRYTHTEVTATGFSPVLTDLAVVDCDDDDPINKVCLTPEYAAVDGPEGTTKNSLSSNYDDVLPSVGLNLNLTDELVLRLASSISMTRPYLEDLAPKLELVGEPTATSRVAKVNNESLQPYKSTNLDASLEWYFDEGSMASVAAYHKSIDDYIVKGEGVPVTIDTIATPEYREFSATRPVNAEEIKVSGVSFNLTQTFEMGLGYQFNYTWVDTDTEFEGTSFDDTQAALPGLGDSLNLVGFYENGPFAARIAYNFRKNFMNNAQFSSNGAGDEFDEPAFTEDYDQVDARVSYELLDGVSVFLEGINLTGSTMRQHGRFDNIFVSYDDFGTRYVAGISGSF